jgi:flavin-dependent dehydrogenase
MASTSKPESRAPCDVVIVGGGPGGSTAATLLLKYNPALRVLVLEKERFPRDHIGESQLPSIMSVLWEMGVWDKVEAAGFPIKLGASLTWGRDNESWDFDFYPVEEFRDEPRPAKYEGQRAFTAFQVDRSLYDTILLRHAEEAGAEVRQGVKVESAECDGDRIRSVRLDTGETIEARWFIDASGTWAVLRRELGVKADQPLDLRNIAVWDYWQNAEWAVHIGVGGTRIQVRSLPYGWIWFIPLGPTRTSIGLVCPAEYYKRSGQTPEALYYQSIREHPQIGKLVAAATPRGYVTSTKDWSTLSERIVGENWFLVGEAAGFADPILSAGMTLAHHSGRDAAYSILELDRGELDGAWLRRRYDEKNRMNIRQHIRFAQYWYAANHCLTDLKDNCQQIAKEAGLRLTPDQAWGWLAQGGFSNTTLGQAQFGSFDLASAKRLVEKFVGGTASYTMQRLNVFKLNLIGATKTFVGDLADGRIKRVECYERAGKILPLAGAYAHLVEILKLTSDSAGIWRTLQASIGTQVPPEYRGSAMSQHLQAFEAMVLDHWVTGKLDPRRPLMRLSDHGSRWIRATAESDAALQAKKAAREEAAREPSTPEAEEPKPSGADHAVS